MALAPAGFSCLTAELSDVVVILDASATICAVSESAERILGYSAVQLVGRSFLAEVLETERALLGAELETACQDPNYRRRVSHRRSRSDGAVIQCDTAIVFAFHDPSINGLVVTLRPIEDEATTDRARLRARASFLTRVQQAVDRAQVDENERFAVLVAEFDQLRTVSATMGQHSAELLLDKVAERIRRGLGPRDAMGQLGPRELGILVHGVADQDAAQGTAMFVRRSLMKPFRVNDQDAMLTATIGVAVHRPRYQRADEIIQDAQAAALRAHQLGHQRAEYFNTQIRAQDQRRLKLGVALPRAIEKNELEVFYQPIVDLSTGRISGFEALARWSHPELGMVSPNEFVPIAENTARISELDRWMLRAACERLVRWHRAGFHPLLMSVNLSAKQLDDPALVEAIASIIAATGVQPESLRLEITESAVAESAETAARALQELKRLGCRLALDDFGTGYSSFGYLAELPLDVLKIDRTFVMRMKSDDHSEGIVHGVIALANRLGLTVVAEGVESLEHLQTLRRMGAAYGQGYLFAKPLSEADAEKLLRSQPSW